MRRPLPLAMLAVLCAPSLAEAQPAASPGPVGQVNLSQTAPASPAGRTDDFLEGAAVDFAISDDEPEASIEVGNSFLVPRRNDTRGDSTILNATWNIKLTVPLAGDDDITSSSTLLGALNGPKLTVNLGLFGFRPANIRSDRFRAIMRQAFDRCVQAAPNDAQRALCTPRADPDFARRHSGLSDAEINRSLFGWMWRAGLEASVSADHYSHVEPATLVERDDSHLSYGAAIVAGFYPPDGMSSFIFRVGYDRTFESDDETIVCRAVVVDPAHDCVNGVPTPAERVEHLNFSLEYRRIFDRRLRAGSLAMSPRATIDALSGEFEVELPIYFIPRNADFPISPGVSLGYSSEDSEVTFGLFLRAKFKL